jgi:hypothetical protein
MQYGVVGDLVRRVIVWGYNYDRMSDIEEEIKEFVPEFYFADGNSCEAVYNIGRSVNHHVDHDSCLVFDLEKRQLYKNHRLDVLKTFSHSFRA